jgi:3-hydroxyisobutyrate dehydrogenase-like beta-hydroxyacid dehydrogenase
MKIGFLGFGEAGQAFARSLGGDCSAYDLKGDALAQAASALHVRLGPPEVLADRDIIISAVTAAVSLQALESIVNVLRPGQVVIDINSVSPGRKQATADVVRRSGASYVDMAVMGPVLADGHRTKTLVAGDYAALGNWLHATGFRFETVGEVGVAAGIKMVRSLFVKGLEAITVSALTAAEHARCAPQLRASLAGSFPGLGWPDFETYEFERVQKHGLRRAAEMRECAAAMGELGLPDAEQLALAIAAVQNRFAEPKGQ